MQSVFSSKTLRRRDQAVLSPQYPIEKPKLNLFCPLPIVTRSTIQVPTAACLGQYWRVLSQKLGTDQTRRNPKRGGSLHPLRAKLPMKRQLIMITILFGSVSTAALAAREYSPPNVILFIGDDISWNDFGCYGNAAARTPRIDALARAWYAIHQCLSHGQQLQPQSLQHHHRTLPAQPWKGGRTAWPDV